MKKFFIYWLLAISFFCAFSVPAFAYTWPPEPYEMPPVFTHQIVFDSFSGLFSSLRAMGNIGLALLGILLSFSLLPMIFAWFFHSNNWLVRKGVRRNERNRMIRAADRAKNMDAIIDDRVAEMEINGLARQKYRELHPDADLEERLYHRQLAYSAELKFVELNPGADIERAVYRREVAYDADREYRFAHPGRDVEQVVNRREVAYDADQEYRTLHPGRDLDQAVNRIDLHTRAKREYLDRGRR